MEIPVARACELKDHRILLFHAHIPKTAGYAFSNLLRKNFGDRFLWVHLPHPQASLRPAEVEERLSANPSLDVISTHFLRCFPQTLCGRLVLYLTFLRDPLQLTLSLFRFLRGQYAKLSVDQRSTLPPHLDRMSLREIAKFHLENWFDDSGQFSMQTAFFSPVPRSAMNSRPAGSGFYGKVDLARAQQELRRFFFVGIVERMAESLELLTIKLNSVGVDIDCASMAKENVTEANSAEESWLNPADEVGRAILGCNLADYSLYQEMLGDFETQLATCRLSTDGRRSITRE